MRRKTMLLAVAALSALALTALPSSAAALDTTPALSPVSPAKFPLAYSGSGGEGTLYSASGRNFTCEATTTTGEFTDAHTGTANINFSGCRESIFNSTCASWTEAEGTDPSGNITTNLTTHSVYLEPTEEQGPHSTPGVRFEVEEPLIIKCLSDFITIEVTGSVLGTIEPGIGVDTNIFKINVSATAEGQEHTTITDVVTDEEGEIKEFVTEEFGLESNLNGGEFEPAYENAGTQEVELTEGDEATTTTETPEA